MAISPHIVFERALGKHYLRLGASVIKGMPHSIVVPFSFSMFVARVSKTSEFPTK